MCAGWMWRRSWAVWTFPRPPVLLVRCAAAVTSPLTTQLACLHRLMLFYFIAETGSGKTAAFVLPMLVYIQARRGFGRQ